MIMNTHKHVYNALSHVGMRVITYAELMFFQSPTIMLMFVEHGSEIGARTITKRILKLGSFFDSCLLECWLDSGPHFRGILQQNIT